MALNTVSSARLSTNVKASNLNSGFGQLGYRNLSINGADMMIAQRGTSTTGLQNTGGVFTIDRFAHRRGGTWANAEWKDEQVDSGTGLFKKALKKTTTTAEGSAAASGKFVMIGHYLEAQDSIAAFGDGTAEAKSFTISFYVKASIATTYCLHVSTSHLSTNKAYMKQFTVNNPNVWERKTCTIPAITNSIGTVNTSGNSTGLRLHWVLDAPTRSSSQAADTWFTFTDSDFGYPTGQGPTGYANTLNATFELGGVQVEAGSVATDLEHKKFGEELNLCKRYCQVRQTDVSSGSPFTRFAPAIMQTTSSVRAIFHLTPAMRAIPSATKSGNFQIFPATGFSSGSFAIESGTSSFNTAIMMQSSGMSGTAGSAHYFSANGDATAKVTFDAEL